MLPTLEIEPSSEQVVCQTLVFGETDGFKEPNEKLEIYDLNNPFALGCTKLELTDKLNVYYKYDEETGGIPPRIYADHFGNLVPECKLAFTLKLGQIGKLKHNGRFTTRNNFWYYTEVTVNIGFLRTYDQSFLISNQPQFEYEKLADLW